MRHRALVHGSIFGGLIISCIMGISGTATAYAAEHSADAHTDKLPSIRTTASLHGFYSGAYQTAWTSGGWAVLTVAAPYVSPSDKVSDVWMTFESTNGRQIVGVGWGVSGGKPHLRVMRATNGVLCEQKCGYIPAKTKVRPGMELPEGKREFGIEHRNGAWWIGYNKKWIGRFPDSLWHGRFKKSGRAQWYGAVVSSSTSPCTDMGNGQWASSPSAASFSDISYFDGTKTHFKTIATNPKLYSVRTVDSRTFRFGGGGAC